MEVEKEKDSGDRPNGLPGDATKHFEDLEKEIKEKVSHLGLVAFTKNICALYVHSKKAGAALLHA
jgi:hypothetical protein